MTRTFASDNQAGVHPDVLAAIGAANDGHAPSYGEDPWTAEADELLRAHFGPDVRSFPVFNGTGANVAALDAALSPSEAAICSDVAHVNTDECGAVERLLGIKLLPVASVNGKLAPADVARWEPRRGDQHSVQPRVVTLTQATELGTVYSAAETRAIADAAHQLGMYVHVDGARLANAAAALNVPLRALTSDVGVDLVSFGGTKNGLLFGEAVVFCDPELADGFAYRRKQLGQLASKMRFVSVQLTALLRDDLWLEGARHANAMAARLASAAVAVGVELVHPVEANAVFARLDRVAIDRLIDDGSGAPTFGVWDYREGVCRWMCSWDTRPEDVDGFVAAMVVAIGRT